MCSVVALSFSLPFSVAPFKPLREESYFPSSSLFIHAHHDFVKRTHNLNAVFQCAMSMSTYTFHKYKYSRTLRIEIPHKYWIFRRLTIFFMNAFSKHCNWLMRCILFILHFMVLCIHVRARVATNKKRKRKQRRKNAVLISYCHRSVGKCEKLVLIMVGTIIYTQPLCSAMIPLWPIAWGINGVAAVAIHCHPAE